MTERRFSDEEFARIIRAAQELQERDASGAAPDGQTGPQLPARGMSVEEIQAVAGEVGVSPEYVQRAVAILTAERPMVSRNPILGGPTNFAYRTTVPGRRLCVRTSFLSPWSFTATPFRGDATGTPIGSSDVKPSTRAAIRSQSARLISFAPTRRCRG